MYVSYFRLNEKPFSLTPDTHFYFNTRSHSDALNTLLLALRNGEGFIKIVGEVGTGKTILCRKLLASLDSTYCTAYIPNPYLRPDELKAVVGEELQVPKISQLATHQLIPAISKHLIDLASEGKQAVLVIDEAQSMPRETIEALRLLTNLETEKQKLLQVVLFGQPELDKLLDRADLRQLKQRIVFAEYLKPFDRNTVVHYVDFRLASAGYDGPRLFTPDALRLLNSASGGVPRLINILCHKAMLCAFGRGDSPVTSYHLATAVADTPESQLLGRLAVLVRRLYKPLFGLLLILALALVATCYGGIL
ncbi:MAG: AAA family ATPase [Gammaproteobacteria bacterium]|nr:AAA family ATPase [Gammaproteobacteria bacterium]